MNQAAFAPQVDVELDHRSVCVAPGASEELRAIEQARPRPSLTVGDEPWMEIGFDDETSGESHDFRPKLPVEFRG